MSVALVGPAFADDLTIGSKTTAGVTTSAAANGSAGNITIGSAGSVELSDSGAAVTIDSNNSVINSGLISSTPLSNVTGVHILGNLTGNFTNIGNISLPGNTTTSLSVNGVLLDGNGTFVGNFVTMSGSSVSVSGFDANAFAIKTELNGNFTNGGLIKAAGPGSVGITTSATIDGAFVNNSTITTITGTNSNTNIDASPGSTVAIGASVLGGIRNAGPVNGSDTTPRAIISTDGSAPAFNIAPSVGGDLGNITIGTIADLSNPGYSFINRGNITALGNDPTVATTAVQIGNAGTTTTSYKTIFLNGLYNAGFISAAATSDNGNATLVVPAATNATAMIFDLDSSVPMLVNDTAGTIKATTGGPVGGTAVAVLIRSGASLPSLNNAGTISAAAAATNTGITTLGAYAILDGSGNLTSIVNSGTISATATSLDNGGQIAVAAELSASTAGATFTDTGIVIGDIRFGNSANNQLIIEGANASVNGKLSTVGLGRIAISVSAGGTGGSLTTNGTIRASSLTVGEGGTLVLGVGTGTTGITSNGNATFAATSHLDINAIALLPTDANITLIHSDTSLTFANYAATTSGIEVPFLFNGSLTKDAKNLTLSLQRKSATDLGLTGEDATLYEPAMQAAATDASFGAALSNLGNITAVKSVLNQLAPVANSASLAMFDTISDSNTNAVGARQRALMLAPNPQAGGAFWAEGLYNMVKNSGGTKYSGNGEGGSFGVEYANNQGHIGAAFTFFRGDADEKGSRSASSNVQWYMFSPYAGIRSGNAFIDGQINVGAGQVRNERTVDTGTVTRVATGTIKEQFVTGGLTGGYVFNLGSFQIAPEASITGMYLGDNNYKEHGGGDGVDLSVSARSMTAMTAFFGVAGQGSYDSFGGRLTPHLLGGWSHDIVQDAPDINAFFTSVPSSAFTVTGPTIDRSQFVGAASVGFEWNRWNFGLGYNASVWSNAISQTANFSAIRRF